ncbi:MAG TPA: hypothetical protein VMR98_05820 [Candidatus Polarisedimenticolaceae bacterium]|nr:hypothetical protein [Candidatus Polarisedimenticolaceae bacterium]
MDYTIVGSASFPAAVFAGSKLAYTGYTEGRPWLLLAGVVVVGGGALVLGYLIRRTRLEALQAGVPRGWRARRRLK